MHTKRALNGSTRALLMVALIVLVGWRGPVALAQSHENADLVEITLAPSDPLLLPAAPPTAQPLVLPVGADRMGGSPAATGLVATSMITGTQAVVLTSWTEGFADITTLPGDGWAMRNNSDPVGTTGWFQGNDSIFGAQSGAPHAYMGANFNSTSGTATISNWLITPETVLRTGDQFSFWTRTVTGSIWPDRLQVRLSIRGSSTFVGATATDVGDFETLLLEINPTLAVGGYPEAWTKYTITLSGLAGPTPGRLAFRYYVTNGGPSGSNSNYIGIDSVEYVSGGGQVLHNNGRLVNEPGAGPNGYDASALQTALGMSTLGFGCQLSAGNRLADEFTVTSLLGWTIDEIAFYAYQTGSTIDSTITGVNYRIWDGPPGEPGSSILFGETTTNRIIGTSWSGIYRTTDTQPTVTSRPIMYVFASAGVHLPPGTYGLDWQLDGTLSSGPWQPPITINGLTTTGNAVQYTSTGWGPANDLGTGTPQGMPFTLLGDGQTFWTYLPIAVR